MASRADDDSERRQETPRPKPPRDENIQPAKPRSAKPPPDDWDDEPDDRPRRRSRPPEERRRDDDGVSTIIPYHNAMALAGYYVGVFSLIPCVGLILGPLGLIFGIVGLRRVNRNPEIKGTGHAVTAIVLGGIATLGNYGVLIAFFVIGYFAGRR